MSNSIGFEIKWVNVLMRRRHSVTVGTAAAALSIVATLYAYGWSPLGMRQFGQFIVDRAMFLVLFGLLFGIGGRWTVLTWQGLWRRGRSRRERIIYNYGVRTVGFVTAVGLLIIAAYLGCTADSGRLFGPSMIAGALAGLFFGVPVCLNLGYFWGRAFAMMVSADKEDLIEIGDPPPVK